MHRAFSTAQRGECANSRRAPKRGGKQVRPFSRDWSPARWRRYAQFGMELGGLAGGLNDREYSLMEGTWQER